MPYKSEAAAVLSMWREVERKMHDAAPGTAGAAALIDEWARLRAEYARLTELARAHHRPMPDPWPIVSPASTALSMGDTKRELADQSDEMLAELTHLTETEVRKREESISTPPYHRLSDEVTASSRRIYELGAHLEDLGNQTKTGDESIEDVKRTG